MKIRASKESIGKAIGIISIMIPSAALLLIANWLFHLTRFQQFQGISILIAPFAAVIGLSLAIVSAWLSWNKSAKWGLIVNAIVFVLPFIYWILGTLIFGF